MQIPILSAWLSGRNSSATSQVAAAQTSGGRVLVAASKEFAPASVLSSKEELPKNWVALTGAHAPAQVRLNVAASLHSQVAVIAYPSVGGTVYQTVRLAVAGWTDSPESYRHALAINSELGRVAENNDVVLSHVTQVEATRTLIAEINGLDASEQLPTVANDHAKAYQRAQENRAAQSINQYAQMIQELLAKAVRLGTADIHISVRYDRDKATGRNCSRIKFRVDGDLTDMDGFSEQMNDPAALRGMIGYMWNEFCVNRSDTQFQPSNFLEATMQDRQVDGETVRGRFKTFDLGDACAPNGDRPFKLVLRIIYVDRNKIPTLEELGFSRDLRTAIDRFRNNHKRLLSISGPVGAGKSTTLRSVFALVPETEAKYSVEDPIENTHPNTDQINASTPEAMDKVLKGLKRGDLNALLMGEVRTKETLELVVNVLFSGHPCYSTTHSDSALGQIPYFMTPQMGMDPALLAHSAVFGLLMHQLLARKLCTCALTGGKAKEALGLERLRHIERAYRVDVDLFAAHNAEGCEICRAQGHVTRIGYKGRSVIAEYFEPDMDDRKLIEQRDFVTLERRWRESRGDFMDREHTYGNTVQEVGLKSALTGILDLRSIERLCGRFEDATVIELPGFVPAVASQLVPPAAASHVVALQASGA